jgi:hypothetical protein
VPLSMCRWLVSVDDVLQRHGPRVRPDLPALPKLFRTSYQAVDSQRSINELGQVRFTRGLSRETRDFPLP